MATLNLCDCGLNFAGMTAFDAHQIGSFQPMERRCLTAEELTAKGWTMAVEPVKRRRENVQYVEQMETWHAPMSDKAREYFAALREQKGTTS